MKNAFANGELGRSLAHLVPDDLLAQRARDLEHRRVVRLLLGQREQLRRQHVLHRRDRQPHRHHLALLRAVEQLVGHRAAGGREDQVDERVVVVRLQQPVLGRALGPHARVGQHLQRALGVLGLDEEVDVVIGDRAAARPDRKPAREREADLGVAERGAACFIAATSGSTSTFLRAIEARYPSTRLRQTRTVVGEEVCSR